jgi:hypothetical protein
MDAPTICTLGKLNRITIEMRRATDQPNRFERGVSHAPLNRPMRDAPPFAEFVFTHECTERESARAIRRCRQLRPV